MPNNILLTGKPRSGKSTILSKLISGIDDKSGFLTREIKENDLRVGFEVQMSDEESFALAHKEFDNFWKVSNYGIDVVGFDVFLLPYINKDYKFDSKFIYLDEIGEMQVYSRCFKKLTIDFLDSNNFLFATITRDYSHPFVDKIKERSDVTILEVTKKNRDSLLERLNRMVGLYLV